MISPPPPRSPWQRLYSAAHARRVAYWRSRAERLAVPVWSVGNLHWGGTGKTPLVLALASWLQARGVRVAILSRGYGRTGGGGPLLVSRGAGPLVSPELSGDEPWLLADELPGVPVAVAARRAEAGRLLLAALETPPTLFLLDDGFSHLGLARDLDLLVLPAEDPFGGGRLLPSGRLREPLSAAARAQALLLSGAESTPEGAREVAAVLASHGFRGSGFSALTRAGRVRRVAATPPDSEAAEPTASSRLLLVTGVARPQRVLRTARAAGLTVVDHLAFPDHHRYSRRSLGLVAKTARTAGADAVLTTAKDRGKLAGRLDLPLWELPLVATPEPAFWAWLEGRLPPPL